MTYEHQELILLSHNHQFTRPYAGYIHSNYDHMGARASRKFHLGISLTVAKIRSRFRVTNPTKLVRSIRHKCICCKIDNQTVETQGMAKLLVEPLKPSAAWSNTSLDFFGPFTLKGEVNKMARGETYRIFSLPNSSSGTKLFNQRIFVSSLTIFLIAWLPIKIIFRSWHSTHSN